MDKNIILNYSITQYGCNHDDQQATSDTGRNDDDPDLFFRCSVQFVIRVKCLRVHCWIGILYEVVWHMMFGFW